MVVHHRIGVVGEHVPSAPRNAGTPHATAKSAGVESAHHPRIDERTHQRLPTTNGSAQP
jgi:hypothetical protein